MKKLSGNKLLHTAITAFLLAGAWGTLTPHATAATWTKDAEYKGSGMLDIINVAPAYSAGYSGKDITIVVSDEFVNFTHPDFKDKSVLQYVDSLPADYFAAYNDYTHGTYVAGIAAGARNGNLMHGVAYDAGLISIDKSNDDAFQKLNVPNVKLINASWDYNYFPLDEQKAWTWEDLINSDVNKIDYVQYYAKVLNDKDFLLIHANGNEGHVSGDILSLMELLTDQNVNLINVTNLYQNPTYTTAADAKIHGMTLNADGSITGLNLLNPTSNLALFTEEYTLAAPGTSIYTANASYATDQKLFKAESGTSFSAPVVTGVAALVQQAHPYLSAEQIGEVLLTTANNNVKIDASNKMQIAAFDTLEKKFVDDSIVSKFKINVYYINSSAPSDSEIITAVKNRITNDDELSKYFISDGAWITLDGNGPDETSNYNVYSYVPLDEFIGQGVVDAGKAVNGLGAVNLRRMDEKNIQSFDLDGDGTAETKQAYFTVDTKGYDATWSNDIKEVQTDVISETSSQTDLQARYKYYYENFINEHSNVATEATQSLVADYLKEYNKSITETGLIGLHGGIIKNGAGSLTLTGANTYQGLSIANEGTLYIDGSVQGGALSTEGGTIAGKGSITGGLYNSGKAVAGSRTGTSAETLTADTYSGSGDAYIRLNNVGSSSMSNTSFNITGNAKIAGGKLLTSGDELVPYDGSSSTAFAAGNITGDFDNVGAANKAPLSGTLSMHAVKNGNSYGYVISPQLNLDAPSEAVTQGYEVLNEIYSATNANGSYDSALGKAYAMQGEESRQLLKNISGADAAAGINLVQRTNLAASTIAPRLTQVFSDASVTLPFKPMHLAGNDQTPTIDVVVPIGDTATEGGWLKYSRNWSKFGDGHAHGSAITMGYDRSMGKGARGGFFASYGTDIFKNGGVYSNVHDWRFGLYGGFRHGNADGYAYVDYGWQRHKANRSLSLMTAQSSHRGHLLEAGGEYRYNLTPDKVWNIKPYANLQMSREFQDGYTENNANTFGMRVNSSTNDYVASELGLEFTRPYTLGGTYSIRTGFKHLFTGNEPTLSLQYLSGKGTTHTRTAHLDKDFFALKAQMEQPINHSNKWSVHGEVGLEQGAHDRILSCSATLKYSW